MLSAFKCERVDGHVLNKASPSKTGIVQKTMSRPCWVDYTALCCYSPFILFLHLFILWRGYLPSACLSSAAGVPRENKPTPAGMEQSHDPFYLPLPSPTLSMSLPICPASLPYDLVADKTRGPAVPSVWCQHFPLIQSQSCCVTDGISDQKQQPTADHICGFE